MRANPVVRDCRDQPIHLLSEDQQPERSRAARPTPGAHSPSLALQRSWIARAARACSAALRPTRRVRRVGWTPGTVAHRSVLHAGFLGEATTARAPARGARSLEVA